MKRYSIMAAAMLVNVALATAQDKFYTKGGKIVFSSKAPLEDIEAHHKNVTCVLDTKTGNIQFAVLMKGFEFEKALMYEHFNENYIESQKFPRAEFKGQISNLSDIDFAKAGNYSAHVKGKLTIHGETREVETTGSLKVTGGKLDADAEFKIELADYKVEIPKIVADNISKTVKITVDCLLEPLKN